MKVYLYAKNIEKQPEIKAVFQSISEDFESIFCISKEFKYTKVLHVFLNRILFVNNYKSDFRYWKIRRYNRRISKLIVSAWLYFFYSNLLSLLFYPIKLLIEYFLSSYTKNSKGILLTTSELIPFELRKKAFKDNLNVIRIVNSWDHPTKLQDIYPGDTFLAWSESLRDDLLGCSNSSSFDIKVIGSPLLSLSNELYLSKLKSKLCSNYLDGIRLGEKSLYIIGTTANASYVKEEVELYKKYCLDNDFRQIVVRPYPSLIDNYIRELNRSDLEYQIDDSPLTMGFMDSKNVMFSLSEKCEMVIHMGTTAGVEVALLIGNCVYLDLLKVGGDVSNNQKNIQQQHHHKKYFKANRLSELMHDNDDKLKDVYKRIKGVICEG